MPVIRFVREGRDVECYPGENLREVALREGIQLYGLKGTLGNCGGCGQCITCFVEVPEGTSALALTARTTVEDQKLRRRPQQWRLACQALVQQSLLVITRPQVGLGDKDTLVAQALATPLPAGPTSWPAPAAAADDAVDASDAVSPDQEGALTAKRSQEASDGGAGSEPDGAERNEQ
jgi:ferredoxin